MVVLGVYRYGASFVLKFLRKSTFLRLGPSGPPLCTNGSAKYLMHLSVKLSEASKSMFVVRNGGHFVFMQIWFKKTLGK